MKEITPKEAHAVLSSDPKALFIDCRSEMEFLFVGHPQGALHVSWNDLPDWDINPHFIGEVRKLAGDDHERPVLVICRSGSRSRSAALALEKAGFNTVYNILFGFEGDKNERNQRNALNGWRFDGLPWEQS